MKKLGIGCAVLAALAFVVLIVIVLTGGSYNRLVRLNQGVDSQWAQVQNVYQRRADLIPNLVATVSGAANFEKSTLTEVTAARASVGQVKLSPSSAPDDVALLNRYQERHRQKQQNEMQQQAPMNAPGSGMMPPGMSQYGARGRALREGNARPRSARLLSASGCRYPRSPCQRPSSP